MFTCQCCISFIYVYRYNLLRYIYTNKCVGLQDVGLNYDLVVLVLTNQPLQVETLPQ